MKTDSERTAALPRLLFFNRLTIGWFMAVAGFDKVSGEVRNGLGSFYRGDAFQGRNPAWLPDFVMVPYGYALPWVELVFGALLVLGLFSRVAAGVLTVLVFTIGIALLGAGELFPRHHVMYFFSISLTLWVLGSGCWSLDRVIARRKKA